MINRCLFICLIVISCHPNNSSKDRELAIVIKEAASYQINISKETYTIYFMTKPEENIRFNLSEEEKNKIIELYYSLALNKIPDSVRFEDDCSIMPKLYTYLTVRSKSRSQFIAIDNGCDKFQISDAFKVKNVKRFIQLVYDIINLKPQIKNAPKSDVNYM